MVYNQPETLLGRMIQAEFPMLSINELDYMSVAGYAGMLAGILVAYTHIYPQLTDAKIDAIMADQLLKTPLPTNVAVFTSDHVRQLEPIIVRWYRHITRTSLVMDY